MRHRLADRKKMFRITTHSGVVDVTSDHSLITECGRVVKPSECSVGVSLMHADLPSMKDSVFKWLFESPLSIRRVYNAKTQLDASVIIWFLNYWGMNIFLNIPARIRQKNLCETRIFGKPP
jgi:hypothetical protein